MNKRFLILGLAAVLVLTAGCMGLGGPSPRVVEDSMIPDISLSKGLGYTVNAVIQNDGGDGDVTVTMKLIDDEKGFVRDEASTVVSIPSGETKKVSLTLDGDLGRDYSYSVEMS
ncbi:hypothetical protein HL657_03225 [Methanoculleus sp. YWC-01]|uniref:CARDB domain-containing protein n=1 Tax=Methanoculleus nereidis TaxID=2735141 RepID=A0ABU3Z066_9EURY|nr:hypothetical protein [Methanoculleus sp. YWC-01]MDV4342199.1 hypothetical protein [Methanoculleus sp. YWC-01]